MSFSYTDYPATRVESVETTGSSNEIVSEDNAYIISIVIPASEVAELLANYDPSSGTSPSVTYSRPLARTILDALKRKVEEG